MPIYVTMGAMGGIQQLLRNAEGATSREGGAASIDAGNTAEEDFTRESRSPLARMKCFAASRERASKPRTRRGNALERESVWAAHRAGSARA
jgi:hypothetical protein